MKRLYLINANYYINFGNWEDSKEEIIEMVKKDFEIFTRGTNPEYVDDDKIYYLDLIRERLNESPDYYGLKRRYVKDSYDYMEDVGLEDSFKVDFDDDFGEWILKEARLPFYRGAGRVESETHKALVSIIKTVMEWEREE